MLYMRVNQYPRRAFLVDDSNATWGYEARLEEATQICGERPTNLFSNRLHGTHNYPASYPLEILNSRTETERIKRIEFQ